MVCVENILVKKLGNDTFSWLMSEIKAKMKIGYSEFSFVARPISDEKIYELMEETKTEFIPQFKGYLYKLPNGLQLDIDSAFGYWKKQDIKEYILTSEMVEE